MKIKEKRFIFADDLRSLCIEKHWFTRGTNRQYDRLFDLLSFRANVTNAALYKGAQLIIDCSDPDYINSDATGIMSDLFRLFHVTYEIEE